MLNGREEIVLSIHIRICVTQNGEKKTAQDLSARTLNIVDGIGIYYRVLCDYVML